MQGFQKIYINLTKDLQKYENFINLYNKFQNNVEISKDLQNCEDHINSM